MTPLVVAAVVVTVTAAIRSTWSPCGISMLSSMTPITERARGHRFGLTAAWYLVGAVIGGVTVGAVLAAGAGLFGMAGIGPQAATAFVAVLVLVTAASDLRVGPSLPRHRRQVNEDWFSGYRRWFYASGFGWQIGNGFATYTTTAALYAVAGFAIASGDPLFALVLGTAFGTIRGLAVILGFRLTDLEAVRRIHARLDAWAEPSRVLTGLTQLAVGLAVAASVHVAFAAALALGAVGLAVASRFRPERALRPVASPS